MNPQQAQELIDVLNRFARAYERHVDAIEKGGGSGSKAGKKKKEALTVRGTLSKFFGPNDYKFYECTIDGKKYSTKSQQIADVLDRAYASDAIVELSYVTTKKESSKTGKMYENNYIESVEIVTSTMVSEKRKPVMPPDESEPTEEAPF